MVTPQQANEGAGLPRFVRYSEHACPYQGRKQHFPRECGFLRVNDVIAYLEPQDSAAHIYLEPMQQPHA